MADGPLPGTASGLAGRDMPQDRVLRHLPGELATRVREHLNGEIPVIYKARRLGIRKITGPTRKHSQEVLKDEALGQADISILQSA